MKIIGSSKIDDYKKVTLGDRVLRDIDAKPGDSILFFTKHNDGSVCIYRADGAQVTTDVDTPRRNHLRGAFIHLRLALIVTFIMMALTAFMLVINLSSFSIGTAILVCVTSVLTLAGIAASIFISQTVDAPYDSHSLVTVGGPYSKNRLTGLSKLTSDGYVITGELFINTLFGANPASVDVDINLEDGSMVKAVVINESVLPGYSVYKFHFKEDVAKSGDFTVNLVYKYIGKAINVHSTFVMNAAEGSKTIAVQETGVTAEFKFDETLNSTEFDEAFVNEARSRSI